MKVKELIEELTKLNQESTVVITDDTFNGNGLHEVLGNAKYYETDDIGDNIQIISEEDEEFASQEVDLKDCVVLLTDKSLDEVYEDEEWLDEA